MQVHINMPHLKRAVEFLVQSPSHRDRTWLANEKRIVYCTYATEVLKNMGQ